MNRPGLNEEFGNSTADDVIAIQHEVENAKKIGIVTGFWIRDSGAPETDGPSSAVHLCYNLLLQHQQCYLFTDQCILPYMQEFVRNIERIHQQLPHLEVHSVAASQTSLEVFKTLDFILFIEKVGINNNQQHLSMRALNINEFTDQQYSDYRLINKNAKSAGVGDGGNEIGCGAFEFVNIVPKEIKCSVHTDWTVLCDVSNLGAYLISRTLCCVENYEFLRFVLTEKMFVEILQRSGFVDGVTGKSALSVDGMDFNAYLSIIDQILE